jgi:flagellar hook-associated protein 1 FlgK
MQWKKDISFTGKEQDSTLDTVTSLAEFFQDIKVGVSSDVETNNFLLETQENVELSLKSSYDQLVKVDKDEEMINLMKFQSAYTANAKVVTAIDEMIQVLLGLKR